MDEEPSGLQSMGLLRVWHDWATFFSLFTFMHWRRKWQPTLCSCLENPRDAGAWWASIHGVAQSDTTKWLSSSSGERMGINYCSSSVAQLCLSLCDPMDCSMPGFPVLHYLLEFAQTHVHWVGDAIQPSHSLSPCSPTLNLSQHQSLFQRISLSIRSQKYWSFNFNISPSRE